jgi:hypothetical protein
MKSKAAWPMLAIALSCLAGVHAAEADKANIMRVYSDTVAPADQQAYETGIKTYNQCLKDHGFKYGWAAWNHETGDTYTYSYSTGPYTWATFDAMHTAGKPCDASFRSAVNPHLKGESSSFLEIMDDMSHMPKGMQIDSPLIEVTFFKLKSGHEVNVAFTDAVKKITAAANKSDWPVHYTFSRIHGGDKGTPDFIVISPSKTWGELGKEADPPLWKMVENAYGEADAKALRKSLNDAIEDESSHVDSYNTDLAYVPAGM